MSYMGGAAGGMGLGDAMDIPCPACSSTMLRMSNGATCPECGYFVGGGEALAEVPVSKPMRAFKASLGKPAGAAVYGEWPATIAKGTRVGFEVKGEILVGTVATYEVDEETGEVTMTIE